MIIIQPTCDVLHFVGGQVTEDGIGWSASVTSQFKGHFFVAGQHKNLLHFN